MIWQPLFSVDRWWDIWPAMFYLALHYTLRFPTTRR